MKKNEKQQSKYYILLILVNFVLYLKKNSMAQIVNIYTEMTPNPNSLKFVADVQLIPFNKAVEFISFNDAKGYSPLAEELFHFPFVKSVFMTSNFVTILKSEDIDWDFIQMELRDFIKNWISEEKDVIIKFPEEKSQTIVDKQHISLPASKWDDEIKNLLEEYVRPAVEGDGGAIDYIGFENGKVHLLLKGSCSGCPSSTATLKFGIENMLKQHISDIEEVVAVNA